MKALEQCPSFSENSNCDLDLHPTNLKRKVVRGTVIPNKAVM